MDAMERQRQAIESEERPARAHGRLAEAIVLFGVAPAMLAYFMEGWMVFPAIWLLAAICLVMLLFDRTFQKRQLWTLGGAKRGVGVIATCFAIGAPLLGLGLLLYEPDRLFGLPRERPRLWAIIMVGYPILSVYPQELAFRAFFFHRYAAVFRRKWVMVTASALAFGYAHVIMHNWVAVAFTSVGGMLFAYTYWRTRSMLACCVEHALYGCFVFTVGWGWYFYGGSIGR
jgi:membrane protease YdiL (CAAX protease family)